MRDRGFSLIEILIIMAVAGMVIAIAIPSLERYLDRTRVIETTVNIDEISRTIRKHEMSKGTLPDSLADVKFGGKADPWGYPYEYLNLRNMKGNGKARKDQKLAPLNSDFDLYSVGRDGVTMPQLGHRDSRDDIVRARDGRFIGLASEFDP